MTLNQINFPNLTRFCTMFNSSTAESGLSSWNMNMFSTSGVIHCGIVPPEIFIIVLFKMQNKQKLFCSLYSNYL